MTQDKVEAAIQSILPILRKLMELDALWKNKKSRQFRQTILLLNNLKSADSTGLIALAENGDTDADHLLRNLAARSLECGHGLPPEMATYIAKFLRSGVRHQKSQSGPRRYANNIRNSFIVIIVSDVCQYGFEPTRNIATADMGETESACSIVAQALERVGVPATEAMVNKIWSKRTSVGRIPTGTSHSP